MLDHLRLENLLVLDIETVPQQPAYNKVNKSLQELWMKKSQRLREEGETDDQHYFNHAAIYAEFGKVICICMGIFVKDKKSEGYSLRVKSIAGDDEKQLLETFFAILKKHYNKPDKYLFTGHNIREFDIPYLCRRGLINGLQLPAILDISGKKPYEVKEVDTMQLWRFGDYKHFTSLNLLTTLFGIESSKEDMSGKDVGRVYWKEKGLERIVRYCGGDVVAVAQLVLRFKGMEPLPASRITLVE